MNPRIRIDFNIVNFFATDISIYTSLNSSFTSFIWSKEGAQLNWKRFNPYITYYEIKKYYC